MLVEKRLLPMASGRYDIDIKLGMNVCFILVL